MASRLAYALMRDEPTDRELAIADYAKGLESNPKFAIVCDIRAWSYSPTARRAKASQGLPDIDKYLELSPDSARTRLKRELLQLLATRGSHRGFLSRSCSWAI